MFYSNIFSAEKHRNKEIYRYHKLIVIKNQEALTIFITNQNHINDKNLSYFL